MKLDLHSIVSVTSIPAVRALAISGALWLAILVYSHYALWRNPHSAYFHSDNVYDLDYSIVRQTKGRDYLQQYSNRSSPTDPAPPPPQHADDTPTLCAAFATVTRDHPEAARYFSDSIGSMLVGLSPIERASFNLTVLFANSDPTIHKDFNAPWLSALVDHAAGYEGISDEERAELQRLEEAHDFQRKGVLDYIYLLDQCYRETRAPFIAVFEDDVIFAADWLSRTILGLQHLALPRDGHVLQPTPLDQPPWLYLRLFYTETHMMWENDDDWLYGHMFVAFGLAMFSTATVLLLIRQLLLQNSNRSNTYTSKSWTLGLRLDIPTIAVLSVIVAPAFLGLFFMAGKYNLPMYTLQTSGVGAEATQLADVGVFPMDKHGCCSQGLVFNREQVPALISYLQKRGRGQTDLMIEEYCNEAPLRRFALGDQVIQHVGLISSRGQRNMGSQSVYAFYFEEKREQEVKKKQKVALGGIDWPMLKVLEAPETNNSRGIKQGLGILPPMI